MNVVNIFARKKLLERVESVLTPRFFGCLVVAQPSPRLETFQRFFVVDSRPPATLIFCPIF